jgi:hypothetical protein
MNRTAASGVVKAHCSPFEASFECIFHALNFY